jgi:hypothetical protein
MAGNVFGLGSSTFSGVHISYIYDIYIYHIYICLSYPESVNPQWSMPTLLL